MHSGKWATALVSKLCLNAGLACHDPSLDSRAAVALCCTKIMGVADLAMVSECSKRARALSDCLPQLASLDNNSDPHEGPLM